MDSGEDILIISALFHDAGKSDRVNNKGLLEGSRQAEKDNRLAKHEVSSCQIVGRDGKRLK